MLAHKIHINRTILDTNEASKTFAAATFGSSRTVWLTTGAATAWRLTRANHPPVRPSGVFPRQQASLHLKLQSVEALEPQSATPATCRLFARTRLLERDMPGPKNRYGRPASQVLATRINPELGMSRPQARRATHTCTFAHARAPALFAEPGGNMEATCSCPDTGEARE